MKHVVDLASKIPRFQFYQASLGLAGNTIPTHGGPLSNLQNLKDLLLTSLCQIPQDTFKDLVEAVPQRVRASMS